MPLKVHSCLLCEDITPASDGRATIVGFLAVAPFPAFDVPRVGDSETKLTLMFSVVGTGKFKVFAKLREAESGLQIYSSEGASVEVEDNQLLNLILGPFEVTFPHYGLYEIRFEVDGENIYSTTLNVTKAVKSL